MKQHTTPLMVQDGHAIRLEKLPLQHGTYDEGWVQQLCYQNPTLLPVDDIEPSFGGIVPICRELQTASGACDLIYINENGFITIGECKLWRNPEARRQVVGQILDYAKDLSQWDYSKFQQECLKARKGPETSLHSILAKDYPDLDEREFIDRVQRNLRRGRFLLLIVGDGIRENMEALVQYLQGQGTLNFSLSLLEIPIFKNPNTNDLVLTPRVLVKTRDIERTIVRIVERLPSNKSEELDQPQSVTATVSDKVFFERLTVARGKPVAQDLAGFLEVLQKNCGTLNKMGKGKRLSLNIKSPDDTYNFGSVQETGEVWFYGIVTKTGELGDKQLGISYLEALANLVKAEVDKSCSEWSWAIKRHGQFLMVDEYLAHGQQWQELVQSTLRKIQEREEA